MNTHHSEVKQNLVSEDLVPALEHTKLPSWQLRAYLQSGWAHVAAREYFSSLNAEAQLKILSMPLWKLDLPSEMLSRSLYPGGCFCLGDLALRHLGGRDREQLSHVQMRQLEADTKLYEDEYARLRNNGIDMNLFSRTWRGYSMLLTEHVRSVVEPVLWRLGLTDRLLSSVKVGVLDQLFIKRNMSLWYGTFFEEPRVLDQAPSLDLLSEPAISILPTQSRSRHNDWQVEFCREAFKRKGVLYLGDLVQHSIFSIHADLYGLGIDHISSALTKRGLCFGLQFSDNFLEQLNLKCGRSVSYTPLNECEVNAERWWADVKYARRAGRGSGKT